MYEGKRNEPVCAESCHIESTSKVNAPLVSWNFSSTSEHLIEQLMMKNKQKTALKHVLERYATDPDVIGVYLFGSVARGTATGKSDIDVCIVKKEHNEVMDKIEKIEVKGIKISIIFRPMTNLDLIINQGIEWAIEQLRECKILYDPSSVIRYHVDRAHAFKIPAQVVMQSVRLSTEALESADDLFQQGDETGARTCINYALWKAARAFLGAKQILYRGPKYLSQQLNEADKEIYGMYIRCLKMEKLMNIPESILGITEINEKATKLLQSCSDHLE